ncbi:MAG TPA: glycosyltransferase family A protein [Burkholderiaceae bacterium]
MSSPLVSVIITCFNRENYLGEAIDSVLAQTFEDYEIVLIDDGSTDGSARIAATYAAACGTRLRYIHQGNQGASSAKNAGVRAARGCYLAFLDSDDAWTVDKLAIQIGYMRQHRSVDLLHAHARQFVSPELSETERARFTCSDVPQPAPTSGTLLVEKTVFDRVGDYRTDLVVGIDVEWHLRAKSLGLVVATLPDVLLNRRLHL